MFTDVSAPVSNLREYTMETQNDTITEKDLEVIFEKKKKKKKKKKKMIAYQY